MTPLPSRRILSLAIVAALGALPNAPSAAEPAAAPPKLSLSLRSRVPDPTAKDKCLLREQPVDWNPAETAIIVCDMWDKHWCPTATDRVGELAPRMNQFLKACRRANVSIIHAPSECMDFYADHPARRRAQQTPPAPHFPDQIDAWCHRIPAEEKGKYPIDQSDGGCDCENPPASFQAWKRQHPDLEIDPDRDYVTDRGQEVWSILEHRGLKNVLLMGVHTNMCVLGRPFGLRNLARNGKNVALVRDLTDTMYNPRAWPQVSHFRGTDLIVEHIEKFVCPTIASNQVLSGPPFRFAADRRPRVTLAISEPEYQSERTLPQFAADHLEGPLDLPCTILQGDPKKHSLPGFTATLPHTDLLILSIRRQALPPEDIAALRRYLDSGKPLLALRTASHAFDPRPPHPEGRATWPEFDRQILGGNYQGHHGTDKTATIEPDPAQAQKKNPLLAGIQFPFQSHGSLYKNRPLQGATPLLLGRIDAADPEPVAWTHQVGASRIFYTSLGHPEDFIHPHLPHLLKNATSWLLNPPTPTASPAP